MGMSWLGPAAAVLLAGAHAAGCAQPLRELRRLAAVGLFGAAVESAALGAGLYGYAGGWAVWWLAPAWTVSLWILLGATFESALRPLARSPRLAAPAGAIGGALGFALALKLGAVRFIVPAPMGLAVVSVLWAALLPLAFSVSRFAGGVTNTHWRGS